VLQKIKELESWVAHRILTNSPNTIEPLGERNDGKRTIFSSKDRGEVVEKATP
jgi:hypothetical protein